MAFVPESAKTPAAIGDIRLTFILSRDDTKSAQFRLQVLDQNGELLANKRGNLIPHLTTGQRNGAEQLLDDLKALAEAEILP